MNKIFTQYYQLLQQRGSCLPEVGSWRGRHFVLPLLQ